jgi:hypothetical protein
MKESSDYEEYLLSEPEKHETKSCKIIENNI